MNAVFKRTLLRLVLFQIGFIVAALVTAVAYARGAFSPRTLGILLACLIATSVFVLIRFVFRRTTQPDAVPVTETPSPQHNTSRVRFLKGVIVFLVLALAAGLLNFPHNGPVFPLLVGIGINVSFIIVTYRLLRRIQRQ